MKTTVPTIITMLLCTVVICFAIAHYGDRARRAEQEGISVEWEYMVFPARADAKWMNSYGKVGWEFVAEYPRDAEKLNFNTVMKRKMAGPAGGTNSGSQPHP